MGLNPSKLVPLYRDLLMQEARTRLCFNFHSFLALLVPMDRAYVLRTQEIVLGERNWQKDAFVDDVREIARKTKAVGVWFAARGWSAPSWSPRPSKHPEGKRVIMLAESTILGDRWWNAYIRSEKDDHYVAGPWTNGVVLGGRFGNLLGSGPRLVKGKKP